jgi:hypothetical protein
LLAFFFSTGPTNMDNPSGAATIIHMGKPWMSFAVIALSGLTGWLCGLPLAAKPGLPRPVRLPSMAAAALPIALRVPSKISSLTGEEIKLRVETMLASPVRNSQEFQLLMARWVVTDLEAAKAWMRAFPDDKCQSYASSAQPVRDFFKAWAALDPAAAMAEALAVKGEKTFTAQDAVITGLAGADFGVVAEVLSNTPEGKNNPREAVAELMKQLLARDRPAALALAMSLPGAMGDGAVQGIAAVWARTDPRAALDWSQQHADAATRDNASKTILTEWARHDPLAVGPMLLQKRPGAADVFHQEAAAEAIARLSASSPEAAAEFVAQFYPQDRLKANLSSLFFRLMRDDGGNPQSAAAMCACVNLLPPEMLKTTKLWGNRWMSNLKPSWERVLELPDSPGRQFLLGEIGRKFATQDPVQMVRDIMKEPDAGRREELLRASFSESHGLHITWGKQAIEDFRRTVESLPSSVQGLGAAHLAWSLWGQDPLGAAEVIRQYPKATEAPDLITNLGYQMAGKVDLPTAQNWADSLPTTEARGQGYSGIVSGRYSEDSEATSRWVQGLPAGPGRDGAASSLANYAKEDDPEAAFAWAASVQDSKIRIDAAKGVVKSWAAMDLPAAQQAVEQSSLPPDQKTLLLNSMLSPP